MSLSQGRTSSVCVSLLVLGLIVAVWGHFVCLTLVLSSVIAPFSFTVLVHLPHPTVCVHVCLHVYICPYMLARVYVSNDLYVICIYMDVVFFIVKHLGP